MCGRVWCVCICVCVSEGQLGLTGISGAGGLGSPGQRTPATATGTPWTGVALTQKPYHLEGDSSGG